MSKESTQEASSVHAKQVHYERKTADMSLTISKLQASLREAQKDPSGENSSNEASQSDEDEMANQIKLLSEEVLRLRDKVANHNSESLTMKSRLRTAIERATKAEEEVAAVTTGNETDEYDSMERAAPSTGNGLGRRRRPGAPHSGSIRTAMSLNAGQGERTEKIGKVVDAVDAFAGSTGKVDNTRIIIFNWL
jgi:chromosome segregation ATPase